LKGRTPLALFGWDLGLFDVFYQPWVKVQCMIATDSSIPYIEFSVKYSTVMLRPPLLVTQASKDLLEKINNELGKG